MSPDFPFTLRKKGPVYTLALDPSKRVAENPRTLWGTFKGSIVYTGNVPTKVPQGASRIFSGSFKNHKGFHIWDKLRTLLAPFFLRVLHHHSLLKTLPCTFQNLKWQQLCLIVRTIFFDVISVKLFKIAGMHSLFQPKNSRFWFQCIHNNSRCMIRFMRKLIFFLIHVAYSWWIFAPLGRY